jgi:SAM-dependent methyltransferase
MSDFWDERYKGEEYAFGLTPNAFLVSQLQVLPPPPARIFAPGDGEGRNGVWLAEHGYDVTSVDLSPKGVEKARRLAASRGVTLNAEVADLESWAWPSAKFDAVVSLYVHFFDESRSRMHRATLRALKPGGVLILEAFSPHQLELQKTHHSGGPKTENMLYSVEKLSSDFADADILLLEEAETELDEGHRHKGRAAVIRCVARRRAEAGG